MKKGSIKHTAQWKCPLIKGVIDSSLCIDVQECIEGNISIELQYEDFIQTENHKEICEECEYHI